MTLTRSKSTSTSAAAAAAVETSASNGSPRPGARGVKKVTKTSIAPRSSSTAPSSAVPHSTSSSSSLVGTRSTRSRAYDDVTAVDISAVVGPSLSPQSTALASSSKYKKRSTPISSVGLPVPGAAEVALGLKRPRSRTGGSTASFATDFDYDVPGDLGPPAPVLSPIRDLRGEVVQIPHSQTLASSSSSSSSSFSSSSSSVHRSTVSKSESDDNLPPAPWIPHARTSEFVMHTPLRNDGGIQGFDTCLDAVDEYESPLVESASKMSRSIVLQRALSIEELDDNSWLTSTLIDLVFTRFARRYPEVDFLAIDFAMISLTSPNPSDMLEATDILGRKLQYDAKRPMVMLYNSKNIHWILMRVQQSPYPELQLFEPMGQPNHRRRPMSFRIVPREVIRWLDTCCPIDGGKTSWLAHTRSAITTQQQFTSFDCGVACLLYAEKCGQGQTKEEIDNGTSQQDITAFRKNLQRFVQRMRFGQG